MKNLFDIILAPNLSLWNNSRNYLKNSRKVLLPDPTLPSTETVNGRPDVLKTSAKIRKKDSSEK